MSRRNLLTALVPATLLTLSACGGSDRDTQITVALSSETQIPQELDAFTLQIIVTKTGDLRFSQTYYPRSGNDFPTTLAVVPLDEDSLRSPIRIELQGMKGADVFLKREAVVSYFRGRNVLLAMPLRMACFDFKDCGNGSTCSGGQCVPSTVDAAALPTFDPRYVFGEQNPACLDEQACLPGGVALDVRPDCSFDLPATAKTGTGNIAVRWAVAPGRVLALDEGDKQQGWSRTADGAGVLSQGVCDSHFKRQDTNGNPLVRDWAETIYFSSACATKTELVPYCHSSATGHAGIGALDP